MRGPRLQVGSTAWVAEERASALKITDSEVEEFTYSAQNEFDWLNEHMAGIFNENEVNIAETFKTPGKLRGKTPRTARKPQLPESRVPLSDVFGATPSSTANRFAQQLGKTGSPRLPPASPSPVKAASPRRDVFSPKPSQAQPATQDSGYYGSQDVGPIDVDLVDNDDDSHHDQSALKPPVVSSPKKSPIRTVVLGSADKTFRNTPDDQVTHDFAGQNIASTSPERETDHSAEEAEVLTSDPVSHYTPELPSSPAKMQPETIPEEEPIETQPEEASPIAARSPIDGSSPIRPAVVRKSSLNFASLPAREPLTAGKSRASRTSHLDHHRMSHYNRHTGGKSLGNFAKQDASDDEDRDDDMDVDVDDFPSIPTQDAHGTQDIAMNHNRTYTQTLQDRINMLGKSQPNGSRTSKSLHSLASHQPPLPATQPTEQELKSPSPKKPETTATTPGAFPEDDDDDWIDPPPSEPALPQQPPLSKSNSTDVMEGIHGKASAAGINADQAVNGLESQSPEKVLSKSQRPIILAHSKAASVSAIPTMSTAQVDGSPLKKTISVSNPSMAAAEVSKTPAKSPSRSFRDSPLKQVKNKLSSILKGSKNLLASSAAISAEGKSSILSPSTTRLGTYPSLQVGNPKGSIETQHMELDSPTAARQASPSRPVAKRTRASVEREKEEKRRQIKDAAIIAEQMDKLEKERAKEREKVRVFSKEQEKLAAMEKQVASKKENETAAPKETPKPTRTSPRKVKVQHPSNKAADQDTEMMDASATNPPPSVTRSVGPGHSVRGKEIRRPMKPGKETQAKAKPTPTVIRVNTGSQHSQFHPASSTMSSSFQDTSTQSQQQLGSKASKATLAPKPSAQSLKSSVSSVGRPKALDLAAKKKEQDEREAQRRRDAKADFERKRAAAQDQQRRQEAERQKQKEREQAETKKSSQRQAAIEKAKQTRAPPPAVRTQPNGPVDHSFSHDKSVASQRDDGPPARPPSRMNSGIFKSQEDGRLVNTVLSNASKAGGKRTIGQDSNDFGPARHAPSYGGPHYQAKDAKRRRTSDDFADELDMDNPPNIKGPPVRPSGGFKKDLPAKSIFQNGYANVPQSATRDLFKATVTAQHTGQAKAAHPLDMAQISKGVIPFAPNPASTGQSYKTPARPGAMSAVKSVAKSVHRSSPQFQNGDSIELPEIHSDEDDDDDDDANRGIVAAWADSPDLRRALMQQELMDPAAIFGPPAPLNMDEVFSKYKDKTRKFRPRTSSANWSGLDRLTEEDIRKDLAARDKLRRDGGWTYELSRDVM